MKNLFKQDEIKSQEKINEAVINVVKENLDKISLTEKNKYSATEKVVEKK